MKRIDPAILDGFLERGYACYSANDFNGAKQHFAFLARSDSNFHRARACFALVNCALNDKDYTGAQGLFTRALDNALETKDFGFITTITDALSNRFFQKQQYDSARDTLYTGLNVLLQKYTPANETGPEKTTADVLAIVSNPAVPYQEKAGIINFFTNLNAIFLKKGEHALANNAFSFEADLWERAGNRERATQVRVQLANLQAKDVNNEWPSPEISEAELASWLSPPSPGTGTQPQQQTTTGETGQWPTPISPEERLGSFALTLPPPQIDMPPQQQIPMDSFEQPSPLGLPEEKIILELLTSPSSGTGAEPQKVHEQPHKVIVIGDDEPPTPQSAETFGYWGKEILQLLESPPPKTAKRKTTPAHTEKNDATLQSAKTFGYWGEEMLQLLEPSPPKTTKGNKTPAVARKNDANLQTAKTFEHWGNEYSRQGRRADAAEAFIKAIAYYPEPIGATPAVVSLAILRLNAGTPNAFLTLSNHFGQLERLHHGTITPGQRQALNAVVTNILPSVQHFAGRLSPGENDRNKRFFQQFGLSYEAPAQFAAREGQRRNAIVAVLGHDGTPTYHQDNKRHHTEEESQETNPASANPPNKRRRVENTTPAPSAPQPNFFNAPGFGWGLFPQSSSQGRYR